MGAGKGDQSQQGSPRVVSARTDIGGIFSSGPRRRWGGGAGRFGGSRYRVGTSVLQRIKGILDRVHAAGPGRRELPLGHHLPVAGQLDAANGRPESDLQSGRIIDRPVEWPSRFGRLPRGGIVGYQPAVREHHPAIDKPQRRVKIEATVCQHPFVGFEHEASG